MFHYRKVYHFKDNNVIGLLDNCTDFFCWQLITFLVMIFYPFVHSGNFFYRKSTIARKIAAIEANNDTYCLQKRIEKFPLYNLPCSRVPLLLVVFFGGGVGLSVALCVQTMVRCERLNCYKTFFGVEMSVYMYIFPVLLHLWILNLSMSMRWIVIKKCCKEVPRRHNHISNIWWKYCVWLHYYIHAHRLFPVVGLLWIMCGVLLLILQICLERLIGGISSQLKINNQLIE